MKTCLKCNKEIPEGRLKAKPDTDFCVNCSEEQQVGGFQVISSKTEYSELQVLDIELATKMRKLQNRRSYAPNLGLSNYAFENQKNK